MVDSCVITRAELTSDNEGGFTIGAPQDAGPLPCKYSTPLAPASQEGSEFVRGGQEAGSAVEIVSFPAHTDVRGTDVITLTITETSEVVKLYVKAVVKQTREFTRKAVCANLNP